MKIRLIGATAVFGLFLEIALQSTSVFASEHEFNENSKPVLIIDAITCQGNTSTECSFVTKKYYQQIGDVLNPDEIADAKLRLGTLIQFKSVNIHLEKGYQRDHVVVVFDVNEASNLQYELGIGYDYTKIKSTATDGKKSRYGLNGKITNFNFLGTGKELSFSFSDARDESEYESSTKSVFIDSSENYTEVWQQEKSTNNSDDYALSLSYYDPYLLGSSYYYLAAHIQYDKYSYTRNIYTNVLAQQPSNTQSTAYSRANKYNSQTLLFGRRFGRYSYISLDVVTNNAGANQTSYGVSYGWNTEDDALFPTQGSVFSTRVSEMRGDYGVNLQYKEHVAVGLNRVIMFGGNITLNESNNYCNACYLIVNNSVSASIFSRYSSIKPIDKTMGTYAGWYIGFHVGQSNISKDLYKYTFAGINAGYTYQTATMIYRFSLAFNQQENN